MDSGLKGVIYGRNHYKRDLLGKIAFLFLRSQYSHHISDLSPALPRIPSYLISLDLIIRLIYTPDSHIHVLL